MRPKHRKTGLCIVFVLLLSVSSASNWVIASICDGGSTIAFEMTYGGTEYDGGYWAQQTEDGGYILGGNTRSWSNKGAWLVKTCPNGNTCDYSSTGECEDAESGTFVKVYGSSGDKIFHTQQASDGGYIAVGEVSGLGAGSRDIWFMKVGSNGEICDYNVNNGNCDGNETFSRVFGGPETEMDPFVQETFDEVGGQSTGYIIAVAETSSFTAGVGDRKNGWLIKTNASGDTCDYSATGECDGPNQFVRVLGGDRWERTESVEQTSDGGYIIAGSAYSTATRTEGWLVKTDENGDTCDYVSNDWNCNGDGVFSKTFGDLNASSFRAAQQTADGGYIAAGKVVDVFWIPDWQHTSWWPRGWLVKTNTTGDTCDYVPDHGDCDGEGVFARVFGGSRDDQFYSLTKTWDMGYIAVGTTYSFGAGNAMDSWLVKTNATGDTCNYSICDGECQGPNQFAKKIGRDATDWMWSIRQTFDRGYVLGGYTYSIGTGPQNIWLVKTDWNGNTQPTPCTDNADCDDANACTINRCIDSNCEFWNSDLDGNHNVGLSDVMRVISAWAQNEGDPGYVEEYDIDGNGNIGLSDIMQVISIWATNC